MTRQEAFDTVARALLAQGEPALLTNGRSYAKCVYIEPSTGHRCGIGHLLSEEQANSWQDIGGKSLFTMNRMRPEYVPDWMRHDIEFYLCLQNAHDLANSADWLPDWTKEMCKLAADFDLSTAVFEETTA